MTLPAPASPPVSAAERKRNRALLVLIFVIFIGSAAAAVALRLSGFQPRGMGNHGELLDPPVDLRQVVPQLMDGSAYHWNPSERIWRIVILPPADCGQACIALAGKVEKVWQLLGRQSVQVHVLWAGEPPPAAVRGPGWRMLSASAELRAGLPRVDDPTGIPVYVIDPNGFVMMRHAPGFDPADLRTDLSKLLKLR